MQIVAPSCEMCVTFTFDFEYSNKMPECVDSMLTIFIPFSIVGSEITSYSQKLYLTQFLSLSLSLFSDFPERRYGCYRLGILVACIIVLVLIVGTIPASLTIRNNKIVLIFLCATVAVVLIMMSMFFVWQQRHARRMRERYGRPYVPHIYNQVI